MYHFIIISPKRMKYISELFEKCKEWSEKLGHFIGPAGKYVNEVLEQGSGVVLEGAQGILLDLDHGVKSLQSLLHLDH